ncbi:unnamed protein product, partial [Owenia fusiformis]
MENKSNCQNKMVGASNRMGRCDGINTCGNLWKLHTAWNDILRCLSSNILWVPETYICTGCCLDLLNVHYWTWRSGEQANGMAGLDSPFSVDVHGLSDPPNVHVLLSLQQ